MALERSMGRISVAIWFRTRAIQPCQESIGNSVKRTSRQKRMPAPRGGVGTHPPRFVTALDTVLRRRLLLVGERG